VSRVGGEHAYFPEGDRRGHCFRVATALRSGDVESPVLSCWGQKFGGLSAIGCRLSAKLLRKIPSPTFAQ
jgi:hypothetical protein